MSREPDAGVRHQRALAGSAFFDDVNDVPAMHYCKVCGATGSAHKLGERVTRNTLKWGLSGISRPQFMSRDAQRVFLLLR
jgi:hypothetical protein